MNNNNHQWLSGPLSARTRWRWLVACLLGVLGVGGYWVDSSGWLSFALLTVLMGTRFLRDRYVRQGRASFICVTYLLAVEFIAAGMVSKAIQYSREIWVVSLYGAALALMIASLVGDSRDVPRRVALGLHVGYGLAALVSSAIASNLFNHPDEFVFPLGAIVLVIYGFPGAALGGGLAWGLRMSTRSWLGEERA